MYLHAISRILTALYIFLVSVFSHKKVGLRREPVMLLNYDQKRIELPVHIKASKGNKVGWHNPLNGSVSPMSYGKCRILLDSRPFDNLHTVGGATIMFR